MNQILNPWHSFGADWSSSDSFPCSEEGWKIVTEQNNLGQGAEWLLVHGYFATTWFKFLKNKFTLKADRESLWVVF